MIIYSTYFRPLKWYTGVVIPLNEINAAAKQLVVRQSIIIGLMCIVGIIAVFVLVSRISKPLTLLSHYARRLPRRDLSKPLPEDSPIDELIKKHKDEVGALAASFVLMRRELNKNIQNLVQGTTARLRMESELNIAREIQLGMVPKTFPFFPDHPEFDLYATLTPAKEVGGDLYDFFLIDEDRLCFTLGDVSEKGVPSALFMVVIRTLIRTLSEKMESPGIVMEKINEILSADNPRSMFVKLVIGILNFRTGEILYANGGHNPPVVMPCNSECYFKKGNTQPVVGAVPGISYTDISLRLEPQDSFFLYTDGVNEAMDADSKQFSSERQLAVLEFNKENSAEQVINAVLGAVRKHAGNAVQSDDIAMLMIKYQGSDFI
jgi:sigma-B regulation protein RsbU (phosphoserine phosphatase)